jgi:transposase
MLMMLKRNPTAQKNEIASKLGIASGTMRDWSRIYKEGGTAKMLEYKAAKGGRKSALNKEAHIALEQKLNSGDKIDYPELFAWVAQNYAPDIKYKTLQQYIRSHFKQQLLDSKLLQVNVKESVEELEKLAKDTAPFIKPRIDMLLVLKQHNTISKSNLAREVGIAYNSAVKWCDFYTEGGLEKLLDVKRGSYNWEQNKRVLFSKDVHEAIEKKMQAKAFATYAELYKWIRKEYLSDVKYSTLLKHIHEHFGNKLVIERTLHPDITESLRTLEEMLHTVPQRIKPRINMLIHLKKSDKVTKSGLAKNTGVTYGSIRKWYTLYNEGGINTLLEKRHGNIITSSLHAAIEEQFKKKTTHSFAELFEWVNKQSNVSIRYNTLHRYVCRHFRKNLEELRMILKVPVKESLQDLFTLGHEATPALKARIAMIVAIKNNPMINKPELSKKLNLKHSSILRWCRLYETGGIERLVEMKSKGRKRLVLPKELHTLIEQKLSRDPFMPVVDLYTQVRATWEGTISYNKLYRYVRRHFNESEIKLSKNHAA